MTLSLLGGALRVLLGAVATGLVGHFAGWQVRLSIQSIGLAVGFAAMVGCSSATIRRGARRGCCRFGACVMSRCY
ncbi:MAG: hypothetical protein IPH37_16870 [Burkholderiales bacterium]|nr:hypothetical protein [Burkholderiales bacterium]